MTEVKNIRWAVPITPVQVQVSGSESVVHDYVLVTAATQQEALVKVAASDYHISTRDVIRLHDLGDYDAIKRKEKIAAASGDGDKLQGAAQDLLNACKMAHGQAVTMVARLSEPFASDTQTVADTCKAAIDKATK